MSATEAAGACPTSSSATWTTTEAANTRSTSPCEPARARTTGARSARTGSRSCGATGATRPRRWRNGLAGGAHRSTTRRRRNGLAGLTQRRTRRRWPAPWVKRVWRRSRTRCGRCGSRGSRLVHRGHGSTGLLADDWSGGCGFRRHGSGRAHQALGCSLSGRIHHGLLGCWSIRYRRRCGLLRSLGGLGGLFRLDGATQSVGIGLASDSVGLCVLNRRRVALDPDTKAHGKINRLLVRQAQLSCQLVDADLLRQGFLCVSLTPHASTAAELLFSHIHTGVHAEQACQSPNEGFRVLLGGAAQRPSKGT